MRSVYWASDLLVMPSLFEGLANAALEGCACGLPAILSHAANVDQIVRHGQSGIEVPTGPPAPLSEALREMLGHDRARLREMGLAGRRHVAQRFAPTPDFVVENHVRIYDQLLERQSPATAPRGWKALLATAPVPDLQS